MMSKTFAKWHLKTNFHFSRLRWDGKETSSDDAEPDDNEELAEQYALLTDEQMLEKVSVAIQSEIGVKHTMIYDV